MPATLLLGQDVRLRLELLVRLDRARLAQDLPALHRVLVDAAQQTAHIVARHPLVQKLAEHLHPGHHRLLRVAQPDDLNLLTHLDLAPLDAPGHHRAAPGNREHVLDRHQERLIDRPLRNRHGRVKRLEQLEDRLIRQLTLLAVERLDRRTANDRNLVAGKLVLRKQLAHFQLHQIEQLRIVDHIDLVEKHHDVGNPNLPRQQDVLARLRHRTVGRRNHEDRAVHLRRPGDHVLDVVGMPRAVHVRVVALRGGVFHVARRNRQNLGRIAPPLALRGLRNLVIRHKRRRPALLRRHLRQRRRQRRLAVVHVTDRPHVAMRLRAFEFLLSHGSAPLGSFSTKLQLRRHRSDHCGSRRPGLQANFAWISAATAWGTCS